MLQHRNQNLVAGRKKPSSMGLGDHIDRFGRIAGEDDFAVMPGVEKFRYLGPGALIGVGRAFRHVMHAAMHIGVPMFIDIANRIDHLAGLLGRSGAVQIDQRLAMHGLAKDREIAPIGLRVIGRVIDLQHCCGVVHRVLTSVASSH